MNITDKNLNLLPIFCVIGEELNLSRAGKRLGLSQPALSHALAKMREMFADPLFVRVPHGLAPTPKALSLAPQVAGLLESASQLFREEELAMKDLDRSFVLAATTYFEMRILGQMIQKLAKIAPNVTLTTVSLQGEFPKAELDRGEVDLAIAGYFQDLPQGLRSFSLGEDPHVCVARKDHPYLLTHQTVDDFVSCNHVMIAVPLTVRQKIDVELEKIGRSRRIVAHINNFLTAPVVVAQTDYLLTCPLTLAESYAQWFDLVISSTPIPVDPVRVQMVWHERNHSDALHRWFRKEVADLMA